MGRNTFGTRWEGLFWSPGAKEDMGVFINVYTDESGKIDRDVMVICGYMAPWSVWNVFQDIWQAVLDEKKIPYIHMTDLMAWREPYDERRQMWGETGRNAVVQEFAELIERHLGLRAVRGVGIALDAKYWRTMKSEDRRRLGNAPDLFIFQEFVNFLLVRLDGMVSDDYRIGLTFDDRSDGAELYNLLAKTKLTNHDAKKRVSVLSFADDQMHIGLQAADMLAYACYQGMLAYQTDTNAKPSNIYNLLTYQTNFLGIVFDAPLLDATVKAWPTRHIDYIATNLSGVAKREFLGANGNP